MSTVQIKIGPVDNGRRMTMEEFLDAEEESGYLYELARGVLEVSEVPADPHGELVHLIHTAFFLYDQAHPGLIRWIGHGSDIRLRIPEMSSDRHPDLGIVFRGTPLDDRGRRRPRLVVEVVSPGPEAHKRDYVDKNEEYLALGIREYWIVDPKLKQVTVLSRQEGTNGPSWSERVFQGSDVIVSPLLPGIATTARSLFDGVEAEENGEE